MWSEELIKPEFMWGQIFPRLAAVAERAYKEVFTCSLNFTKLSKAPWEAIYNQSSWDAVESDDFILDFDHFRYALKHFHM